MSAKRYTDEFKSEAIRQVTEKGHKVAEVADRLGVTTYSLYSWIRKFGKAPAVQKAELEQNAEVRRLRAELKRVTEERDILKRPQRTLPRRPGEVRVHEGPRAGIQVVGDVPGLGRASQRIPRLVGGAAE